MTPNLWTLLDHNQAWSEYQNQLDKSKTIHRHFWGIRSICFDQFRLCDRRWIKPIFLLSNIMQYNDHHQDSPKNTSIWIKNKLTMNYLVYNSSKQWVWMFFVFEMVMNIKLSLNSYIFWAFHPFSSIWITFESLYIFNSLIPVKIVEHYYWYSITVKIVENMPSGVISVQGGTYKELAVWEQVELLFIYHISIRQHSHFAQTF